MADRRQAEFNRLMEWARQSGAKRIDPADNPYLHDGDFEQLVENEKQHAKQQEKAAREAAKHAKAEEKAREKAVRKMERGG